MKQQLYSVLVFFCLALSACSNRYHQLASRYTFINPHSKPDYSRLDDWAAHPYKHDPSDSVPAPLRAAYQPDSSVDVFFIHPTTYTEKGRSLGWNAPVDNADLNAKTDYSTILFQASIFNEAGRVFSPRYRQAHLSAYYPKNAEDSARAIAAFELAYQDIKTAFLYYLEHYNYGRPIIIAAHSQGTTHGKRLLKELFDGKPLQNQLVAAYLVGMPLDPTYLTNIKPCDTPSQTGCICGWRTFKTGYTPAYIAREPFVSVVTNPITWDARVPSANRLLNKGSVLLSFNTVLEKAVNASVNKGVLWADKPRFFGNILLRAKNYHIADMNFYYSDIRENAKQRVKAFQKNRFCPTTKPNSKMIREKKRIIVYRT